MALPLVITDLDGTVVNLMDEVLAYLYDITGIALTPECCKKYEVHESFAPYLCPPGEPSHFSSVEALNRFLIKTCWTNPGRLRSAKPYWGLWRTLLFYMYKGGKVMALTSRNKYSYGVKEATESWLNRWLPGHHGVCFTGDVTVPGDDSTPAKKRKACADLMYLHGAESYIFIDDQPEVLLYVKEHLPENCVALMPDRPWTATALAEIRSSISNYKESEACNPAVYLQNVLADHMEL